MGRLVLHGGSNEDDEKNNSFSGSSSEEDSVKMNLSPRHEESSDKRTVGDRFKQRVSRKSVESIESCSDSEDSGK